MDGSLKLNLLYINALSIIVLHKAQNYAKYFTSCDAENKRGGGEQLIINFERLIEPNFTNTGPDTASTIDSLPLT